MFNNGIILTTPPKMHSLTGYERYLAFNKQFNPKAEYKAIADWYAKHKRELPNGVYASENVMTMFYEKLLDITGGNAPKFEHQHGFSEKDGHFNNFFHGLPMFSAWRNSLSIYKLDPDIFPEMIKTPLPADTPSDIFF